MLQGAETPPQKHSNYPSASTKSVPNHRHGTGPRRSGLRLLYNHLLFTAVRLGEFTVKDFTCFDVDTHVKSCQRQRRRRGQEGNKVTLSASHKRK